VCVVGRLTIRRMDGFVCQRVCGGCQVEGERESESRSVVVVVCWSVSEQLSADVAEPPHSTS
jgi:hypothetical protein